MYRGLGLNKLGRPFQLSSSTSSVVVEPHSMLSGVELRGVAPYDRKVLKLVGLCIGLVAWLWAGDTGNDCAQRDVTGRQLRFRSDDASLCIDGGRDARR